MNIEPGTCTAQNPGLADPQEPAPPTTESADPDLLARRQTASYLLLTIQELCLSNRTTNWLGNAGIKYVFQLVAWSDRGLLGLRNFGRTSLEEVHDVLSELGLYLGMPLPSDLFTYDSSERTADLLNVALSRQSGESPYPESACIDVQQTPASVLGEPWERHIVVSPRLWNCLRASGHHTLADLITARDSDLLKIKGMGVGCLGELRGLLRSFRVTEIQRREDSLPSLLRAVNAADYPASYLGSAHLEILAALETRHGALTLGSLAELVSGSDLSIKVPSAQLRSISDSLYRIARTPQEQLPQSLDALLAAALEPLNQRARTMLRQRYLEGLTFQDVGLMHGLCRERTRQVVASALARASTLGSYQANILVEPILARIKESGGILHLCDLQDTIQGGNLRLALLALHIAGHMDFSIRKDSFLVDTALDMEKLMSSLRKKIVTDTRDSLSETELLGIATTVFGHPLLPGTLQHLLSDELGLSVAKGELILRQVSLAQRMVEMLQAAARPMHTIEISTALGLFPNEKDLRALPKAERTYHLQRIQSMCDRRPEIYRVGPGTMVHVNALPVPLPLLHAAVSWCVKRIRGYHHAVSVASLLEQMRARGSAPENLSAYLLKDAMKRHPDVLTLRKLLVGHAPSFTMHGVLLPEKVLALLLQAREPMTIKGVREALFAIGAVFPFISLRTFIVRSPQILRVNFRDLYVHIDRINLSPSDRESLVEQAVGILVREGRAVEIGALAAELAPMVNLGDLVSDESLPRVLWGLLRRDKRVARDSRHHLILGRLSANTGRTRRSSSSSEIRRESKDSAD